MSDEDEWGYLSMLLAGVALVGWLGYSIWFSRLAYELYYSIDSSHLATEKKPRNCDFWNAPIGQKDCHYKRVVSTVEIEISTTTQKPVMSLDGGKSWSEYIPDPGKTVARDATVTSVSVTWEKVED